MTTIIITPNSQFEISSGALCFGSRREATEGSRTAIQDPTCPAFEGGGGGTVLSHAFKYNLKALNGTWNVYKLVSINGERVVAAFCSHESLAPCEEAKRILDIANAPWEQDNGTNRNSRDTWEGCVVVINRYDWMEDYYAEQEDGITFGEEDLVGGGQRNSRWLVDYGKVKDQASASSEGWCTSGQGVRLVIFGEYIYGRFGLVDDRSAVQSFLLFTGDTELSKVTFRGDATPIYIPLTKEERHVKCLTNGSYTGFSWLRTPTCRQQLPDVLVGPFGVEDMIDLETMEVILQSVQPTVPTFEPQLQHETTQLVNESLAVWVHCLGKLAAEANSREEFVREAFPNSLGNNQNSIHALQRKAMERDDGLQISPDAVHRIVAPASKLWTFLSVEKVSCGLKYLLKEILELSGNCARDNHRNVLVPYDVRVSINNDRELCDECLNCSKVFWPPDMV